MKTALITGGTAGIGLNITLELIKRGYYVYVFSRKKKMPQGKAVIGQSGGPTAVINRSLVGFIKEATKSLVATNATVNINNLLNAVDDKNFLCPSCRSISIYLAPIFNKIIIIA